MKILLIAVCLFFFVSCNSNSNSNSQPTPSYQKAKMTLQEQENSNPTGFLKAACTYRKNIIGEWVLEGTITNSATLATYKDIVLRIVYYSKTRTQIGTEEKTLYDYYKPNSTQKFKIKSFGYEGTESIEFQILSASPVN